MSRSHSIWQVTRLVAGATALWLTLWTTGTVRVEGQQRSGKQALLAAAPRAAQAAERLAEHRRDPSDRARLPYVSGHIVAKFSADVPLAAMSAMAADVGGMRVRQLHHADFVYVDIPVDEDPLAAARRLAAKPPGEPIAVGMAANVLPARVPEHVALVPPRLAGVPVGMALFLLVRGHRCRKRVIADVCHLEGFPLLLFRRSGLDELRIMRVLTMTFRRRPIKRVGSLDEVVGADCHQRTSFRRLCTKL